MIPRQEYVALASALIYAIHAPGGGSADAAVKGARELADANGLIDDESPPHSDPAIELADTPSDPPPPPLADEFKPSRRGK